MRPVRSSTAKCISPAIQILNDREELSLPARLDAGCASSKRGCLLSRRTGACNIVDLLLLELAVSLTRAGAYTDHLHYRGGDHFLHDLGRAVGLLRHRLDGRQYPVHPTELRVDMVHRSLEPRYEWNSLDSYVVKKLVKNAHRPDQLHQQPC